MSYKSRTFFGTGLKVCLKGCQCKACKKKEEGQIKQTNKKKDKNGN